jgi:hypothetical protein
MGAHAGHVRVSDRGNPRTPRKRCSRCGTRTARAYHWWLEETSVGFLCDACRTRTALPAAKPPRPVPPSPVPPSKALSDLLDDAA